MSNFLMPSLGADMEAGKLVEILKKPGDDIHRGDIIAAVETQKGVIEIEVFEDGKLGNWLVNLGAEVPVGTPLAVIQMAGDEDEPPTPPEVPQSPEPQPSPPIPEAPQPVDPMPEPPVPEQPPPVPEIPSELSRLRITPAARRKAAQTGVDLADLQVAPGQVIDLQALEGRKKKPEPLSGMRRAIAAAMTRAKREIPHYYLAHRFDLTATESFVSAENIDRPPQTRLLMVALFAKAIALSLQKYPEFNGFFEDEAFTPSPTIHLGLAINLRGGGLVAPALHDADKHSLDELMESTRNLIERVKAGRFRARELSDPTITLTSLGDRGVDTVYGVIFPPQVAIIGIGKPAMMPAVQNSELVPRLCVNATLAADHRVSDGHRGALFLNAINRHLQEPETL